MRICTRITATLYVPDVCVHFIFPVQGTKKKMHVDVKCVLLPKKYTYICTEDGRAKKKKGEAEIQHVENDAYPRPFTSNPLGAILNIARLC